MTLTKSVLLGATLLLALTVAPVAAQDGVAGTWELTVQTPQGVNQVTMMLTIDGTKATGTLTSALGTMPVAGTATADSVDVTGTMEIQAMSLPIQVVGKAEAGALTGSMKLGDFGEAPFSGKRPAATSPAAAAAAPAPVPTSGVAGKWNVTLVLTGMGEFPVVANFTQDGEAITGSFVSMMGEVPVKGTFIGSTLKVEFSVETPQGPLAVTMNGELAGQALSGKASIAGMGEADWKAVRAQ